MKRADVPTLTRPVWLISIAVVMVSMSAVANAQSARFTLIDARNGLTPDVREAYANALGANADAPLLVSRVKVIVSPRHGAAFEAVNIPSQVRHVDATVDVLMQGGGPNSAPIDVNHLRFARQTPHHISQKTNIKGH
ncbi:MAG: hypothetical protein AAFO74_15900 [Pseudomonadota bacterium]